MGEDLVTQEYTEGNVYLRRSIFRQWAKLLKCDPDARLLVRSTFEDEGFSSLDFNLLTGQLL